MAERRGRPHKAAAPLRQRPWSRRPRLRSRLRHCAPGRVPDGSCRVVV